MRYRKNVIPHAARGYVRDAGRASGIASIPAGGTDRCPSVGANTKEGPWLPGPSNGSTTPKASDSLHPDDESGDVFVHYSNIIGQSGRRTLLEGEKVEYEAIEGPKGLQAMNVARAE